MPENEPRLAAFYARFLKRAPRQARSRSVVDAVVIAALESVRRGDEDLVLKKVAERAGVGIGSLYDYFNGEEELLAVCVAKLTEVNVDKFRHLLASTEDLPLEEMVATVVALAFDTYLTDARMPRAVLRLSHRFGVMPMLVEGQSLFASVLAETLRRRSDVDVADVDASAYVIVHAIMGLVMARTWEASFPFELDALRVESASMIVAALRSPVIGGHDGELRPFAQAPAVNTPIVPRADAAAATDFDYLKRIPQQLRSKSLLQKLLRSAIAALTDRGEAFTIAEVARDAGVAASTLYEYFRDRVDLAQGAVRVSTEEQLGEFGKIFGNLDALSLEEATERIAGQVLAQYTEDPRLARGVFTAAHRLKLMPVLVGGRVRAAGSAALWLRSRTDVQVRNSEVVAYVAGQALMGVAVACVWESTPAMSRETVQRALAAMIANYVRATQQG
jgi:AcrR family transcriptional regulator